MKIGMVEFGTPLVAFFCEEFFFETLVKWVESQVNSCLVPFL
jgi:hypothetical protein